MGVTGGVVVLGTALNGQCSKDRGRGAAGTLGFLIACPLLSPYPSSQLRGSRMGIEVWSVTRLSRALGLLWATQRGHRPGRE